LSLFPLQLTEEHIKELEQAVSRVQERSVVTQEGNYLNLVRMVICTWHELTHL